MASEQVQGVGEDQRGRLVAGEEQGHGLVAELLVGHAGAVLLVAGVQEDRQQVVLLAVGPALVDDAVEDGVEPA